MFQAQSKCLMFVQDACEVGVHWTHWTPVQSSSGKVALHNLVIVMVVVVFMIML